MEKVLRTVCVMLSLAAIFCRPGAVFAEAEPFIGEMIWVPYNFAPTGWAFCDGSLLLIAQNQALFSVLGTQYGGDGRTNFALPDMRGRVMVDAGQGMGGTTYVMGQSGGETAHTLSYSEMASHRHSFQASTNAATSANPSEATSFAQTSQTKIYGQNPSTTLKTGVLGNTGQPQPQAHNNMMPYQTLNCIIAIQGIFPSRP